MAAHAQTTILVCYDGSEASRAAVACAAKLLPDARALVVNVWRPQRTMVTVGSFGMVSPVPGPPTHVDEERALHLAEEGVEIAREHGLAAIPIAWCGAGPVDEAILTCCAAHDCSLVVVGASDHSLLSRALFGHTCDALTHHARVPLLVVHAGAAELEQPVEEDEAMFAGAGSPAVPQPLA